MQYPRVIIIGETFRLNEGGGITLSNLFKEWPDDKIGVITDLISHTNKKTKYSYYQLGQSEIKFPFPFSRFQTYFESGPYTFAPVAESDNSVEPEQKEGGFQKLKKNIRPWFDNILNKVGLHSSFYKINISEGLKKWILDFNPDIIYIQPFQHNMMQFGNKLYEELKIPYAIHIMDDSVSYINKSIIFKNSIQKKIAADFTRLVKNAKVHLCISETMADEYYRRYGEKFQDFRNPIEVNHWRADQDETKTPDADSLKIIYTGRIFPPTADSFLDLCKVVDKLNKSNKKVTLNYTLKCDPEFQDKVDKFEGVVSLPPVSFKNLPKLIQEHDIFLICINFDKQAKKYLQFSMSTRASEGMISGVPVLIYAPSDLALSMYFSKTQSGCVIGERDTTQLEEAVLKLWNDHEYRKQLTAKAIDTALNDSDTVVVREEFRKALDITK